MIPSPVRPIGDLRFEERHGGFWFRHTFSMRRHHRPAYLAPARHPPTQKQQQQQYQHLSQSHHAIINGGGSGHDVHIPLLVEIPQKNGGDGTTATTAEVMSPPSSVGSATSFHSQLMIPPSPPPSIHHYYQGLPPPSLRNRRIKQQQQNRRRRRRSPFRIRNIVWKQCLRLYHLVLDVLLLVFVCIMGLFFDVEVQVVKQDRRRLQRRGRGSGRVVIQTRDHHHQNDKGDADYYDGNNEDDGYPHPHQDTYNASSSSLYRATSLLHTPPRSPTTHPSGDEWYNNNLNPTHGVGGGGNIV